MQTKGTSTFLGIEKRILYEVIVIIVLSAIAVYMWFGNPTKYLLYAVDEFLPFNPSYFMQNFLSSWIFNLGTGNGNPFSIIIVPLFYLLHSIMGLSLPTSEYLIEVMFTSLSGISMLAFTETIYGPKLKNSFAPFISAYLYMFSYYITPYTGTLIGNIYFYSVLPLIMLLIYMSLKSIKSGKFPIKELLGTFLVIYFMGPSLSWVWVEPLLFILLTYFTVLVIYFRPNARLLLIYTSFLFLGTVLVSLPIINGVLSAISMVASAASTNPPWPYIEFSSYFTNFLSAMVGMYRVYPTPVVVYAFLLAISMASILGKLQGTLKVITYYFIFLEIIFIPMAAGLNGPFGSIFKYLWGHSIFFQIFQNLPFDFGFVAPLAISVLLPIGLKNIIDKIRGDSRAYVGVALVILASFSIFGTSALTGSWATVPDLYFPGVYNSPLPPARIAVPTYQYTTYQFFKSNLQPWQRIFELPVQQPEVGTPWYFGTDIFRLMGISTISGYGYMPGGDNSIYYNISLQLQDNKTTDLSNELAAFGVKYVVVYTQIDPRVIPPPIITNATYLEEILNSTRGLIFVKQIGIYVIYQVNETLPLVYTEPLNLLGNGTVFSPNSTWVNNSNFIKTNYKIISPYEIKVNIRNATQPYLLVYAETYDKGWSLIGTNSTHVEVLGYANGWIINKKGSYTLTLFYTPEIKNQTFALIQIISTVVSLIALVVLFMKRKRPPN